MRIDIPMPKAGLTMVEGTIGEWRVPEGALIQKGDAIMEYENEKNTIEYESVHGGYLHILEPAGETVEVGKPIAWVAETKEEYDALTGGAAPAPQAEVPTQQTAQAAAISAPAASEASESQGRRHVRATGLARKMAREAGIDLAEVPAGSGPDGRRIAARDVKAYLESRRAAPAAAPAAPAAVEDEITAIPWTGVRKTIARNMMNSLQQSAQCTAMCEVDVTDLLALRQKLVEGEEYLGCRVTVNDLLCKAVCSVLKRHPTVNATFDGKTLYSHKHVHLSLAVATEGGLMVPVIKNADTLTLTELSLAAKDLGLRAREKRLQNGEQGCGTCTVSNVGMFPIDMSTPILNPPEVGIFGFGRAVKKPVYGADGTLSPRSMMWVYLTFDHRVVDGLEAGRVFKDLQNLLEHPQLITA
jgi:pyruvate/2-oxoglutarate dehydrogenase complex dihydrolipoamide acyltransferase (E2) component